MLRRFRPRFVLCEAAVCQVRVGVMGTRGLAPRRVKRGPAPPYSFGFSLAFSRVIT